MLGSLRSLSASLMPLLVRETAGVFRILDTLSARLLDPSLSDLWTKQFHISTSNSSNG